jgi:hypothetical protein
MEWPLGHHGQVRLQYVPISTSMKSGLLISPVPFLNTSHPFSFDSASSRSSGMFVGSSDAAIVRKSYADHQRAFGLRDSFEEASDLAQKKVSRCLHSLPPKKNWLKRE